MVFGQFLLKYSESRNDWTSRSHSIELLLLSNDPYFLASRHVIALPYHTNVAWVNFATNLDIVLSQPVIFKFAANLYLKLYYLQILFFPFRSAVPPVIFVTNQDLLFSLPIFFFPIQSSRQLYGYVA
jgi:hypothetical protein